ncbi:hypothetical protein KS2013_1872 [Kangiella sediminilitoris]|uniref:Sel1 domain protein repeat-containing protein n=2 Tax=Kangiella sediminilitoris TaxID=1144748 RepID=A0A1B3BCP0_9GAMM|nr:hypothetical protein KS2013_1872 [Kangiella sediminilitoris]
MPYRLSTILLLVFYTLGFKSFETWQDIDKQDSTYIKLFYEGKYQKALPQIKRLAKNGDAVAQYTLAKMYDRGRHWISCRAYRNCYPNNFKPEDDFDFSKSKAKLWYKKAISNGHPYAAYMLTEHIVKDRNPMPEKNKKLSIETLLPRVKAGDAVATYMYYELTSYTFAITPQTSDTSNQKARENLEMIIEILLKEAQQGRVLAMHYLGKAYFHLLDYPKSFAWFTAASQRGFSPSGVHQLMVLKFIEKEDQESETAKEIYKVRTMLESG